MSESEERSLIRNYLLGELPKAEVKKLEKQIIDSDEFFNQMLAEEEQMIDEYVYDRMTPEARKKFEESYMLTQEGREQVELAQSLIDITEEDDSKRNFKRTFLFTKISSDPFMYIAASVLILCGLSYLVWRHFSPQSDIEAGMNALNQAYSKQRTIEPRVTAMEYAPLMPTRGTDDTVDHRSQSRAETILRDSVSHNPGAQSHHALGRAYLLAQEFDKAIVEFNAALKGNERNQQVHSDLGAALFEKGKAEERSGLGNGKATLLESLKHLNTAIDLNDSLAEAVFNRGLLYQEMGEEGLALVDWKNYLKIDSTSKWAEEVRRKIELIGR